MTGYYIWIAPDRLSGEPCIGESRLPVEMVARTVWAHGVEEALTQWPQLDRGHVLTACWYAGAGYPVLLHKTDGEYDPRNGKWAKRWGQWAQTVHAALWHHEPELVPDPPGKETRDG